MFVAREPGLQPRNPAPVKHAAQRQLRSVAPTTLAVSTHTMLHESCMIECVSDCSNGVRSCYLHVHYFVKCIRIQQKKCTWTPYSIFPVHVAKILSMCLACDDVLLPLYTCSKPVVNVIVVTLLVPMPMATSQYLVAQLMTKRSRPG